TVGRATRSRAIACILFLRPPCQLPYWRNETTRVAPGAEQAAGRFVAANPMTCADERRRHASLSHHLHLVTRTSRLLTACSSCSAFLFFLFFCSCIFLYFL